MRRDLHDQRGAALLVAITAVAVVTAVAVDLAYNSRVSLQTAANARDELRATYLAKSAVNMSRLVLHFQQQLDQSTSALQGVQQQLSPQLAALQGATAGAKTTPPSPLSGAVPNIGIRLWDLIPIDSSAVSLFLSSAFVQTSAPVAPAVAPASANPKGVVTGIQAGELRMFGDTVGSFRATIQDEERKINIRQFDGIGTFPASQALRLAQLIKDPKWDFLFDQDDANGMRVSRRDLFGALKDYEDQDETSSTFTGDPAKPFENGYGDENQWYDRLRDRYRAKNASYDSLAELFMVAGVSDAFMAAFGDRLTVYPDLGATINVNTDDPQQIMVNALLMSDPPGIPQPALADPAFLQKFQSAMALAKPFPFMSITPQQFAGVLQALGVKVNPVYLQATNTDQRSAFGNSSSTFRIRAVGTAGDVTKTLEAVVTFDRRAEGLALDLGRLLYWHEE